MRAVVGKQDGLLEGLEVERTCVDARAWSMLEGKIKLAIEITILF